MFQTTHQNLTFLISLILINLFYYSVGSFIYFDFNPMNWWLIKSHFGRLIIILIELPTIGSLIGKIEKM
jgi:hypothetical protein